MKMRENKGGWKRRKAGKEKMRNMEVEEVEFLKEELGIGWRKSIGGERREWRERGRKERRGGQRENEQSKKSSNKEEAIAEKWQEEDGG